MVPPITSKIRNGDTYDRCSASIGCFSWYKLSFPYLCILREGMSNREDRRRENQLRLHGIGFDIYQFHLLLVYLLVDCGPDVGGPVEFLHVIRATAKCKPEVRNRWIGSTWSS